MGGVSSKWRGCESSLVSTNEADDGGWYESAKHTERKCTTYRQITSSRFLYLAKDRQSGGR